MRQRAACTRRVRWLVGAEVLHGLSHLRHERLLLDLPAQGVARGELELFDLVVIVARGRRRGELALLRRLAARQVADGGPVGRVRHPELRRGHGSRGG